nr:toxin co-regulated pilus biosynthesis Q family protein [Luteibacter sp. Sphag1AF]
MTAACSGPSARDIGGRWRPVNHFDKSIQEIPLSSAYVYYAAPTDSTLKTLLTRWANDTGLPLTYGLPSDFTIPAAASTLRTTDRNDAAVQISGVYAAQYVAVSINHDSITVSDARVSDAPPENVPEAREAAAHGDAAS